MAAATSKFAGRLATLVRASGGVIAEDLFVTKPGVALIAATAAAPVDSAAAAIYGAMHIDTSRPPYEQLAEFNGRLTYLAFPGKVQDGEKYNARMAREHGHLSPFSPVSATFLIAGVSVETSLELVAHGEAKVARLTSSKTGAMNDTLYRVQPGRGEGDVEAQRAFLRDFAALRASHAATMPDVRSDAVAREWFNILNVGAKATALTYTMNLKDYHRLFIGRVPEAGNETEVREVCVAMCEALHARYPLVVRSPAEYGALTNAAKDTVA